MTYPMHQTPSAPKRWYQRWWVWVIVGVVLVFVVPVGACTAIVGAIVNSNQSSAADPSGGPAAPAPAQPSEAALTPVPDVVGMAGDDARDAVEAAGFEVEFDAGDDSVWAAGNWVVVAQSATEAEVGATIVLEVERPGPSDEPEATGSTLEQTSGGVDAVAAHVACEMYAEEMYPFGIDIHSFIGVYADEVVDDLWFWKVEVTITNAYNAEYDAVMECSVGGTADAPTIEGFLVY